MTSYAALQKFFSESHWILVLLLHLGAVVVASFAFYFVVSRLEKRLVAHGRWGSRSEPNAVAGEGVSLVGKFFPAFFIFVLSLTLGFVPETVDVPDKAAMFLTGLAKFGAILSAMFICLKVVSVIFSMYERQLRIDQPDNLRQRRLKTQIQYLEKVVDLFIVFLAVSGIMLSFESFRRFGGSLLASAGLASVIIGFSAQKSLSNLIAGFQIAFTQPIRLGDAVLVENEWGEIEEIALTYVVVRIWDLRRLIVPITYFLEKPFQNWTRTSADLIGTVFLYVDYSFPVEVLRQELVRLLKSSNRWDGRVVALQVTDSSERTMTLRALMSASNSSVTFDLRCEIREKLISFIQDHYPSALPRNRIDKVHLSLLEDAVAVNARQPATHDV